MNRKKKESQSGYRNFADFSYIIHKKKIFQLKPPHHQTKKNCYDFFPTKCQQSTKKEKKGRGYYFEQFLNKQLPIYIKINLLPNIFKIYI